MTKTKCLKAKHQTPRLPVLLTAVAWLYIEQYKIDGAWLGVFCTVFAIFWIISIVNLFCCRAVEPVWQEEK